jgi:predicted dehydrogenase
MNTTYRVAVVGCGNIARRAHLPAWLADPRVTVAALCDPSPDATKMIRERYNLDCPCYLHLEDAIAGHQANVVDICTNTPFHYPLARLAIEAGCHVLLEKPPAQTLTQAMELGDLAKAQGVKLGVVFNYRHRDLVQRLKQTQESGTLGEIVKINITHHGPFVYGDAPWLWDEKKSKYLLWEFGIHFLDILVYLLGSHEEVTWVRPTVQPEIGHTTDLEVVVQFARGATGRLGIIADSTRCSSFFTHIEVYGTARDAFIRWFPPSFRVVSGQVNPLALVYDEFKSVWNMGMSILLNRFLKQRNISHYRIISSYLDWLTGTAEFPLTMDKALPTIRLLSDIERLIPSYQTL